MHKIICKVFHVEHISLLHDLPQAQLLQPVSIVLAHRIEDGTVPAMTKVKMRLTLRLSPC
jgi:hypothetical protein